MNMVCLFYGLKGDRPCLDLSAHTNQNFACVKSTGFKRSIAGYVTRLRIDMVGFRPIFWVMTWLFLLWSLVPSQRNNRKRDIAVAMPAHFVKKRLPVPLRRWLMPQMSAYFWSIIKSKTVSVMNPAGSVSRHTFCASWCKKIMKRRGRHCLSWTAWCWRAWTSFLH